MQLEKTGFKFTDDCYDPDGGYENPDGYVRVLQGNRKIGRRLVMRHRKRWEESFGTIKEGWEINHLCKNRRCCKLSHLEALEGSEHASKTNRERYRQVRLLGLHYIGLGVSKNLVALMLHRTVHTVNRWIREDNKCQTRIIT